MNLLVAILGKCNKAMLMLAYEDCANYLSIVFIMHALQAVHERRFKCQGKQIAGWYFQSILAQSFLPAIL